MMPRQDTFASLNPEQRRAAEHGIAGPADHPLAGSLLIIAGAGSGKTQTLAHRVAHLDRARVPTQAESSFSPSRVAPQRKWSGVLSGS